MKHSLQSIVTIFLISISFNSYADTISKNFGRSFFAQRPQEQNEARYLAHETSLYPLCSNKYYSDVTSLAVEYTDNFNRKNLGAYLFFNGKNSMVFAGSDTAPNLKDVDALNFFLADNFYSRVEANPHVQNAIVDLHTRKNLFNLWNGLYMEIDLPVVWTKWNVSLDETITNPGTTIAANKLSNTAAAPAPIHSMIEAWKGTALNPANVPTGFPLVTQPLHYAKINGSQETVALTNILFLLGYNVFCCDIYHIGLNARVVAPTGTRPHGEFVFEPVAGNGRHPALGGGIQMHYNLWSNDCDGNISIWFDGYIDHFFKTHQKRTFDWTNNGIGSRYLWLKKFNSSNTLIEIVRGPNITTLDCDVTVNVIGEAVLFMDFNWRNWVFDIGYNVWGRSQEKVTITESITAGTYGILGDSGSNNNNVAPTTTINGATTAAPVLFTTANALKTSDLNPKSAASSSAFSQKVFAHLGRTWYEYDHKPFLGIGAEGEFASSSKKNRALNQWGVWLKSGLTF
jgi:hypothetical protein